MIALVLNMLRARRGQAWTVALLALFATASAIAGPAYLSAVDRAVVTHEVDGATTAERSLSVATVLGPQGASGPNYSDALNSLITLPGFTPVFAENYVVLGFEAGPHTETQFNYRQDACAHLTMVAGRCYAGEREIVIGERAAKRRHLGPGSIVTLTYAEVIDPNNPVYQPVGTPTQVTVVGTYRPRDPSDLYWGSRGYFALDLDGNPGEPIFTDQYTLDNLDHRKQLVSIDTFADPDTLRPENLDTVNAQIKDATDGLTELGGDVQYNSGIPDLIDRIRAGQHLAHQVVPVAAVPLVLLAWFVIFLAVSYGAEARRFELGLLALRGTRLPARWWLAVGESIVPIVLGAAGGFLFGQLAVALLARARLGTASATLVSTDGWLYAVVAGAGAVLCALLAQRRGLSTPVSALLRRVVRPAPAWQALALESLVVILAVVAVVQLRSSGGQLTGIALLVPGLVMLAIALLAGRAVVPLTARYGRRALARGRTGTGLAALQLARRPGTQRLLVLLTVAVALLTFAATATDVAAHARGDEAQVATGATRVISVENVTRQQLMQATRAADPQGRWAMAVVELGDDAPDEAPRLAVDSDRLAAVTAWRSDFGPLSPTEVGRRLHPDSPDTVVVKGTTLTVDATATGFDPRTGLDLLISLSPLDGSSTVSIDLDALLAGEHTYAAQVHDCTDGCRLVGFSLSQKSLGGYKVDLTLHSLAVGGTPVVDAGRFGAADKWVATDAARLTGGADGLTMALNNSSGRQVDSWLKPNDAPYPLPVVSTEALGDDAKLDGLGGGTRAHQVAQLRGLPGLGRYGSMVDLEYADRVANDSGYSDHNQVWLGRAAPANAVALLSAHGLVVRDDRSAADLHAALDGQGPALALWFHLLAAAFAVVLATGGIALVTGVDRRRRTEDLSALRIQGLRRRVSNRAGLWGYLVVVLAALVCGVVAAGVAWAMTGTDLPVFQGYAHWYLPRLPRIPALILPLVAAGALFAAVCAVAAAALRRSIARMR
jgi:putative ABC transport system permease protein